MYTKVAQLQNMHKGDKYMIVLLKDVLKENSRGMRISEREQRKPNSMEDVKELTLLNYTNIKSHYEIPNLSDTIDFNSAEKNDKVYINVSQKYKNSIPLKNDIVLPITTSSFIAKLINWSDDKPLNFIYYQKLIILRVDKNKINPRYLLNLLNTEFVRKYWRDHSEENGKYRLVCQTVGDLPIYLPTLEEQQDIIDRTIRNDIERTQIMNIYEGFAQKH